MGSVAPTPGDSAQTCASLSAIWAANTLEKAEALIKSTSTSSSSSSSPGSGLILQNYIAGAYQPSQSHIDTTNPKTGAVYAQVPIASADQVTTALQHATEAFKTWKKTTAAVRSAYLKRVADLIAENRELFAVWESLDQGKTLARARVEVDRAVSNFNYFSTFILHQSSHTRMVDSPNPILTYEHRSPAGVFALISPWNMPLYLLTWKIAPCLAFGCTAVAKPSEVTSMSAFLLAEVLRLAELPSGVINIVFGDGPTTGSALVKSELVHGVSFTGGTATGIRIRRDTADQIWKHLSLELGGKNPSLIFDDVDLDKAVETAATAAFENQGEICLCGSRVYVQSGIYDEFVKRFEKFVKDNFKCGERVGAVVSRMHYDKIRSYLEIAEEEKGSFVAGGIPPKDPEAGLWIEPTVITGLSTKSRVMREEIFGPVVTIAKFDTEEEAVELANDNPNGLAAVLLTKEAARIRRVGEQIEAGLVWVNCWLVRELGTPFGGMKNSGTGREGGEYSREVFTVTRTLHIPM